MTARLLSAGIAAAAVVSLMLPAAAAHAAEPAWDRNGCVIHRLSDGPVEGGSQCEGEDLSAEKLGQAALQGANLADADFTDADVIAASFVGANLAGADFTDAKIQGADFSGTGIVPDRVEVDAPSIQGGPVEFSTAPPTGITVQGCTIADEPVESGAIFPVGESGILCTLATSHEGTATAVIQVSVTTADTTDPHPVFTASAEESAADGPDPMLWLWAGIGAVVLLGGIAAVAAGRAARR